MKANQRIREPVSIAFKYRAPHGGNLSIQFNHDNMVGKPLKRHGQADTSAAYKWLNEERGANPKRQEPLTQTRHKPGFPPRIAEWATLRNRSHIDNLRRFEFMPLIEKR